jgi:ParE toxin of type II toxin-antitoxin system, parDE
VTLRQHVEASREVDEAFKYYETQRPGLGRSFIAALEHGYDQIEAFPKAWPPARGKTRWYILEKFPFGIVYLELQNEIVVIAVSHLSRRRDYWLSRVPE